MFQELGQLSGLPYSTICRILRWRAITRLLSREGLAADLDNYCSHSELTATAFQQRLLALQRAGYQIAEEYDAHLHERLVCAWPEARNENNWHAWLPTPVGFTNFLEHVLPELGALPAPTVGYAAGDTMLGADGRRVARWLGPVRVCSSSSKYGNASLQQEIANIVSLLYTSY
jgi:hypothetical protein